MASTNGRQGVEEEAGPARPRSRRRGFSGAGSGPHQPRCQTGFQVGQVGRWAGGQGSGTATALAGQAELQKLRYGLSLPACTRICRPGAFCVATGPRSANGIFMHVNASVATEDGNGSPLAEISAEPVRLNS